MFRSLFPRAARGLAIFLLCSIGSELRAQEPRPLAISEPDFVDLTLREEQAQQTIALSADRGPVFSVSTRALLLRRTRPEGQVLATAGVVPILDAAQLEFDYELGQDVAFTAHGLFGTRWDVEARYFEIDEFESRASATAPAGGTIPTTPAIFFGGPQVVTSTYVSDLENIEINFRRQLTPWLNGLVGVRYLTIENDRLNTSIGGIADITFDAGNHLVGVQMGGDAELVRLGPWSLKTMAKGGAYYNQASVNSAITGVGGAIPFTGAQRNHTAFVGEIGAVAEMRVTRRIVVHGGYQALWIDGVALGTEQYDNTDIVTGAATADVGGSPLYHGAFAGFELRFGGGRL